jgi:hypothetical protein
MPAREVALAMGEHQLAATAWTAEPDIDQHGTRQEVDLRCCLRARVLG